MFVVILVRVTAAIVRDFQALGLIPLSERREGILVGSVTTWRGEYGEIEIIGSLFTYK